MTKLSGHVGELRDPTLEELYTGPVRDLPDEIQQLPAEDTACTFCGVSYFVFAEVQALQTTVKEYKKTFRDFVRFMERERSVERDLRQQTIELRNNFAELVATCSASTKQLSEQNEAHRAAKQAALDQVQQLQKELMNSKEVCRELQILSKRNEVEQKMAHALVEQKLRNEISNLSSQVESCKLLAESQQATFKEDHDRDQQRIRELQSQFAGGQARWTTAESQMITERDVLKQQLLAINERVVLESKTSRQLEVELTASREELARVVAANDKQRKSHLQMNSEVIQLKHQVQNLEKTRAQLLSENGRYKDDKYKLQDEINALRLRADQLQGQLSVSTTSTEKVKGDYTRELEKLRGDHEVEISRLQCKHTQAIEELKTSQHNYVGCLKKETMELQTRCEQSSRQAILAIEDKHRDAERRANEWKDRAWQNANEREEAKRNSSRMVQELQTRLNTSEHDKQKIIKEAEATRVELEQRLKSVQHEVRLETSTSRKEAEQRQKILQDDNMALQQRIDKLQDQLEHLRKQPVQAAQPPIAWKTNHSHHESSNQDDHENEKIIDQLRTTLKQKEREIAVLQQTVHRECMERTSLLQIMRSGKVAPEIEITSMAAPSESIASSNCEETDDTTECFGYSPNQDLQPKASFYEKLRRAGSRKAKPRK